MRGFSLGMRRAHGRSLVWLAALSLISFATAHAQDIDSASYRIRRQKLARLAKDGIVVIQSVEKNQQGLTEYLIDDSDNHDFLYLTGVEAKGATLVLVPQSTLYPEILFVPEKEIDEARAQSGVKTIIAADKFESMLGDALTDYSIKRFTERKRKPVSSEMARVLSLTADKPVALNYPRYFSLSTDIPARVQLATRIKSFVPSVQLRDASPYLDLLRTRHDSADMMMITKVVQIGSAGLVAAMKACRAGMTDEKVDAVALAEFEKQGASRRAYPSLMYIAPFARKVQALSASEIAKSSEPESAVHQMEDGDLVMLDAGAEYKHYASDLSRTVPVSGKFTPEQRKYYDAILEAHHAAIAAIRPGATFKQVNDIAVATLHKYKLDQYFTFATSHFIGMDAHDAGDYDKPMVPGMVFTVEPGIIDHEKNIVIHVEDIILVTPTGHKNLSASVPIEATDIEKLMAQK
jgi:Xaa-Pro aminopeptidase